MSFKSGVRLFCYLTAATVAYPQTSIVKLSGQVTDPSGAQVPKAVIRLDSRDASTTFSGVTNQGGEYEMVVPRGDYLLHVEAPGLTLPGSPKLVGLNGPDSQLPPLQLTFTATANTVVVTATGTAQSLDETAKSIDVVSRDELMRRGTETIVDGVRELPGLRVSQRGGPGSLGSDGWPRVSSLCGRCAGLSDSKCAEFALGSGAGAPRARASRRQLCGARLLQG